MPLDTRANRDEEHKQAIIQYEKSVIEPKLVETVRSEKATEGKKITISFTSDQTDKVGVTNKGGLYYAIGMEALIDDLGRNMTYILKIIGDLYKGEGYDVSFGGKLDGYEAIEISQPSQEK